MAAIVLSPEQQAKPPAPVLGALKDLEAITNKEQFRDTPLASFEVLLSGLAELLRTCKQPDTLSRAAVILEALAQHEDFGKDPKCRQQWLRAAKQLVSKDEASPDALRCIVQCLHRLSPVDVISDWCHVGLQCLLRPEVRTEVHTVLCTQRKVALAPPRRGVEAPAHAAIKECLVPQLTKWMDNGQGCTALQVWSLTIEWMGEYVARNASSMNLLLRIASRGFGASSQPQLQKLAMESWKVLISAFKPEALRSSKMLGLVLVPLQQRPSVEPQARLALVRTLWHLAATLGPYHLAACFQQAGLLLLKTLGGFLSEGTTIADRPERLESLYALLRLLQLPVDANWKADMDAVPLTPLGGPLETSVLGRHLKEWERTCRSAIGLLQQNTEHAPSLGCLLMHLLLKRAVEAHTADNVPVAAAMLKLVLDGLSDWLLGAPQACKRVLEEASQLPEKMLTSHCYYSGKLGVLHGTPVLSLLKLLLQPALLAVFSEEDEVVRLFGRLVSLGLQNPSRLHLTEAVLGSLERCSSSAASLLCELWLCLCSALLPHLQQGQEVNQGSDLEPDFSALVAALAFPVHHCLPCASPKVRKTVVRKWCELYKVFGCSAALVPNVSPHAVCHETWRRIGQGLTPQLQQDIGYVDSLCDLLATVSPTGGGGTESSAPSPPLATGASPLRCWGSSHRNSPRSALGDLQPFCHALAWALEAAAHKAALPSEAFSVAAVVVKLGRLLQGLLASLRGTAPVVELLGLLGPSLAQLLGSSLAIKLEGAWSALCSLLSGAGPWDESQLLGCLSASLEAALGQPRPGPIRDRALHLWQSLFTRLTPATKAQLPPSLREVLRKVKPSLVPVPAELSQDSLVPDACLPSTPPKKEALSFSPLALPSKGGRRTLAPSPSKSKRPSGVGSPALTTPTTRKRRSLYDFRAEEFVEVVSPIKKQQVLTEHQREVRKERRSLPALYSNLSQSNLDSHDQDSEDTPQSEEMDAKEPTWAVPGETKPNGLPAPAQQSSAGVLSNPVIIVDSDSGEENEPLSSFTSAALLASREACRTPPLQELQPQNTAGADAMGTTVVPETQQDDTAPLLETPKGVSAVPCTQQPAASGSPRVHRPKAKLSFARSSAVVVAEVPEEGVDVVPSSQSTTDSSEEAQPAAKPSQPLVDPHPDSHARVWRLDKDSGRLVASQDSPSPQRKSNRRRRKSSLARAQEETKSLLARGRRSRTLLPDNPDGYWQDVLEDGIAPLADDEPEGSSVDKAQLRKDAPVVESSATEEQTMQVDTVDDETEPATQLPSTEAVVGEEVGPTVLSETVTTAPSDDGAGEVCSLQLSEGGYSLVLSSDVPEPAAEDVVVLGESPEFGEPLSEDTEVATQLAAETEGHPASSEEDLPIEGHVCTVPETEDNTGVALEMPQGETETQSEICPLTGMVKGARKRKLPSQATSPIASRLRAKQARQQEHGSPPPSGAGGASNGSSRPPRWAVSSVGSPAALSRSRIMVDAARRNSAGGSSPSSRHSPSHNGGPPRPSPRPPAGILKRPPADGNSPQPKQSGRHVSFADPPVQGECEVQTYKKSFSRALYEEPEAMDEGELVDSQLAVFPALEGCTESVNAVLPFLASSLWQSTLGRRLRQQGLCTVGQLASLTAAQVLQLPLRTPKVASLRVALQQYADSRGEAEESPLPPATAPTTQAAEVCNGLADSPEVELCDLTEGPAAAPSVAATPSLDLEEDEALPCGQATGQEGDVAEESAAVTAVESVAASLVFSGPSPQTAEPKTLHSSAVQCKPSTTVVASQTGPVVLSKEEVCQLLTSDFFASLERVDLGRILATIATVVAADRQTTAGFL
ncbi:uncharacterized protein LOC144173119 isoform X1 [Haemaphysalis longicornis]